MEILREKRLASTLENNLKGLTRDCIREHLKQIHPLKSLYVAVTHLGLPLFMQSYLLFGRLPKETDHINYNEMDLLSKTSKGNIAKVQNLIQNGLDVNVQDDYGMTALMIASQAGNVELIQELPRAVANVNIQNIFRNTVVICATLKKQNNCVHKLIKIGANTNIQDKDGLTALMHAAKNGDINCLETLIGGGADPNVLNDDDCSNRIITSGVKAFSRGSKGLTALSYAACAGNTDCVKKLIEVGADVNSDNDSEGNTPLMTAIENGKPECVKELIPSGADLNIKYKKKMTALVVASGFQRHKCFSEMMKAGAELNPSFLGDIARKVLASKDTGGKLKATKNEFFSQKYILMNFAHFQLQITDMYMTHFFSSW